MSKSVLMVGNLSDGFRFVGPFDSHDDADNYSRMQEGAFSDWIVTIEAPKDRPCLADSAPELLAALKLCKQALKNYIDSGYDEPEDQEAYAAAMAALSKAEGGSK